MAFINKEDFDGAIRAHLLQQITNGDDNMLQVAANRAIKKAKGYLNSRYVVDEIFNKEGEERDPEIVGHVVDMTLFYLHKVINPVKVPEQVIEAYREAKEWFFLVSEQKINPTGLPVPESGEKDYVKYGSNPQRTHHY